MPVPENFNKNIQTARKHLGITKKQLAEKAGLTPAYIRRMERVPCNLSLNTLRIIAKCLNVEMGWLLEEAATGSYPDGDLFCERLKRIRKEKNLKQDSISLGEYAEGDMLRYCDLENGHGNPTIKTLYKISRRMQVSIGDLIDGTRAYGPDQEKKESKDIVRAP